MTFVDTPIPGAYVLEPTRIPDDRGFFEVGVDRAQFEVRGLNAHIEQVNYSFNAAKGTLRGIHFQTAPYAEPKVVRCLRGAAFDVTIRFDEAVDVVEFESFSNLRTQVQITVSAAGVSAFRTSDGVPHMVVERTSAGIV